MAQVGLQTKPHDDVAVREHLSVALTLCSQASNNTDRDASEEGMKRVLRAASLLRDQSGDFCEEGAPKPCLFRVALGHIWRGLHPSRRRKGRNHGRISPRVTDKYLERETLK